MKEDFELERDVEKQFNEAMKNYGAWPLKFESANVAGVPDRVVLCPNGVVFFAEIKRPGAELRPLQKKICGKIQAMNIPVLVIRNVEDIRRAITLVTGARVYIKEDFSNSLRVEPEPVTKNIKENTIKLWLAKVDEELNEFKETAYANHSKERQAEEACDTITALTSMLEFMGIDREQRMAAQAYVNAHNRARGRI